MGYKLYIIVAIAILIFGGVVIRQVNEQARPDSDGGEPSQTEWAIPENSEHLWSEDKKTLAIKTRAGVFAVNSNDPKRLHEVFVFTEAEQLKNPIITDLRFIDEDTFTFQVYRGEEKITYQYNAQTGQSSSLIATLGKKQKDTANGLPCIFDQDCRSGFCSPGPLGWRYCLHDRLSCAKPGEDGVRIDDTYSFEGKRYQCKGGNQLVEFDS